MGLFRAGPLGGIVALIFWMLPAWIVMTAAGIGAKSYLHGESPSHSIGILIAPLPDSPATA